MDVFAKQLRLRAEALGLSNAEVARKVGLSQRRYHHYVTGAREPDLATLCRIAKTLDTTPNELLLFNVGKEKPSKRAELIARLADAARRITLGNLSSVVAQTEALARAKVSKK